MKPKCEVCGDRHESHQAHVWRHVANSKKRSEPVANTVANVSTVGRSVGAMRVKLWRQANRERYNARERERMRRNRKTLKEKRDA